MTYSYLLTVYDSPSFSLTSFTNLYAAAPVVLNIAAVPSTAVYQGTPLTLTCEVVGDPTLNVMWTTPTGPMVGSVIIVNSVTANNAGDYTCEVTSDGRTVNISITITGEGSCKDRGRGEGEEYDEEQVTGRVGDTLPRLACWSW